MIDRKHTHIATCQLCDKKHAANIKTTRVAKHGYTKQWGFFSGTCPGSDNLPYEYSCDLIPARIANCDEETKRLEKSVAAERAFNKAHPTVGFLSIATGHDRYMGRVMTTVRGTFAVEAVVEGDYGYNKMMFTLDEPLTVRNRRSGEETKVTAVSSFDLHREHGFYSTESTPADYAKKTIMSRIAALQNRAKQIAEYRAWLVARATKWTKRELTPVVVKVDAAPGATFTDKDGDVMTLVEIKYSQYGSRSKGWTCSYVAVDGATKATWFAAAHVTKMLNKPAASI